MSTTEIEKKSLEAHVEICAVRYSNLETKLEDLTHRIDKLEVCIIEIRDAIVNRPEPKGEDVAAPYKMMLTIGTTIGGALLGILGTLIVHIK